MQIILNPSQNDKDAYGLFAHITEAERKEYMQRPKWARDSVEKLIKKELDKARKKAGKR